ncbi:NAD-dependent epimerase/dehydratase family protein [Halobellus limi]|uniref:NAD-dependent epimerase/dehydratase family protein n=1 Tax=Halobellus limi TaxID=699433 RepID=A0A1H5TZU7_9EURY|nr:NAD-dependent epimerase/dehydratase family protein [Halobellus limi]QCC47186.1 NAD-dependent epimerase/dehydratase family protein [Halobellus limi]SEF68269.1 UDP-glucose 4-epimerase [Halobellus limi]
MTDTVDAGLRNRNVLITGGAGFIGSRLAERLQGANAVTVLDDFSTGARENLARIDPERVVEADVRAYDRVRDAAEGQDVVVHLAAMMGVQRTLENPLEVLSVNIEGTQTVLQAARDAGVERVAVASTSEVYGDAPVPPYAESDETAPKTNYAVAKLVDERFTKAFAERYGLEYTVLRYFNVYGPRQDGSEYGYVVPIFLSNALDGDPVTVHGAGDQTRDFTHVRDAVRCTVRALGPAGRNETFNVGTGTETSVGALARKVVDVVGDGEVVHVDHPRPYTVERRVADVSKATEKLGYEPEIDLDDGLRSFLDEQPEGPVESGTTARAPVGSKVE